MIDLDHFKEVNELHGHLVGDEVLRRVGRALREAVRPYDFVARYGGDEFAIVAVDAHEERAAEIGGRAIARIGTAVRDVVPDDAGAAATAGVSQWTGGESPADLVREADRALLYGKQQGVRGEAIGSSTVPGTFMLGGPVDDDERPPERAAARWPSELRRETEPLRKHTRQLALANALGTRLAGMTRTEEIVDATVMELRDAFGYTRCAVVTLGPEQSLDAVALRGEGVDHAVPRRWREVRASEAVERSLIERQAVIVDADERRFSRDGAAELAVPIWTGAELWGALDVQSEREFEEPDVRLLQAVADQVGSALHSAALYEKLEQAYLGTAEAVTAALESRDALGPEHAQQVVANAEAVGRRLGMSDEELRDLRYAAAFHDIGKVKVPESVLNKPGPLTEEERREVERHAVAVEDILGRVEYLAPVIPLVRHIHERWDGGGYPDGLAGESIPLGARVLLVCDAHDAMLRERPYRRALPGELAREEIRSGAGREFDTRVADAFLAAVEKAPTG
jgi:diguanylate cyclase (GGDEF)-like protein